MVPYLPSLRALMRLPAGHRDSLGERGAGIQRLSPRRALGAPERTAGRPPGAGAGQRGPVAAVTAGR